MEGGGAGSLAQGSGLDPLKVPAWIILWCIWGGLQILVPQGGWVNESLLHQSLTQVIHEMASWVLARRHSFDPAAPVLRPHPLSSVNGTSAPVPGQSHSQSGSCCPPLAPLWASGCSDHCTGSGWCQDTSP